MNLIINKINNITNNKDEIKFKKVEVKKVKKERNMIKINDEDDKKNKSILTKDLTKRMNSFMDFSIVLNDNSKIKERENKNNISKFLGDVSVIDKKDDINYYFTYKFY